VSVSRKPSDWVLLFSLVAMWGSSFMFNKLGVATVPPATLAAARLALGALLLLGVVYALGLRLPPRGRVWFSYAALALVGNAIPFYLISWGQQVVDSALAGILIAVMPLATLLLAHFLVHGERMVRYRVAGFVVGFLGIVVLMGPAAVAGFGGSAGKILSECAVLAGALCYASNSVMTKLLVKGNALVASAATLLVAAAVTVPFALVVDRPWTLEPSGESIAAIVWLGIGPTAIATICYYKLIGSTGPTFMSLVNYMSPVVAVFLGVTLLGEHPGANAYAGLALILAGIALSQLRAAAVVAPVKTLP
jgi:drug/metabolite transporter (DMT)-like permease